MTLALLPVLVAAGALLGATVPARSDVLQGKGDSVVARQAAHNTKRGWVKMIARFDGELQPEQMRSLALLGVHIYRTLPIRGSAAVAIPAGNLERLAALTFVRRLSEDVTLSKSGALAMRGHGTSVVWAAPVMHRTRTTR